MKTLSGHCESSKEIAVSKATKILFKFVSADNGASQVINAYLHRASAAFNELNQFHRELKPSLSHRKNRGSRTTDDNGRVVESYAKNKKKDRNLEGENAKEEEQQKEMEKKISNNVKVQNGKGLEQQQKEVEKKLSSGARSENGGLVGSLDIEIRSKKKHEVESESKLLAEGVKTEQRKKRRNENVEDGYGEHSKKKMKRKHKG